LTFAISVTSPVAAKDSKPTHIILSGDYVIEGLVGETPVSLKVDAGTPDRPILNPKFVEKIDLKKSLIPGGFNIGPVKVPANTKVVKFEFDGMDWKRRSLWADRAYTTEYDGGVGPAGIPHDIITFKLRTPQAGEQKFVLPLIQNGNSVTKLEVAGKSIDVTFTLKRDRALATAAAGAIIAENHGGAFAGEIETAKIALGVERPIRAITLSKPIDIIGLALDSFFVRTKDGGDSSGIADGDLGDDAKDLNEIVVIGKKGKKDKNRYAISLGRDDLSHCSSITYNKLVKEIQLFCKPEQTTYGLGTNLE
jgi:hypothetical protein